MVKDEQASLKDETINEKEVIKKIINGDVDLFSYIIDKYQKIVLILVERFIYNIDDADDAVQDIFIKIYNNISKFKFKSSLKTWIYRITVNHCIERKRKNDRMKTLRLVKDDDREIDNLIADTVTPEDILNRTEIRESILRIIDDNLSKNQKSSFILKYFDGLQIKEIANIMNMKEGTVKTHLSRAYSKIRDKLRRLFNE